MKKIKLIAITLIATLGVLSSNAQEKGSLSVGGTINAGTAIPTASLGATVQYNITNDFRLAGNLDYFIKNKGVSSFDISVDVHYVFKISKLFSVYPIVGVGISILSVEDFGSRVPFIANFGGGLQFDVSDRFRINFEIKGRIGHGVSQAVVGPSFNYIF